MSLLSSLAGSSKKTQTQTSTVTDVTTPVSIGGDANAPVFNVANSAGANISLMDGGAIKESYNFAADSRDAAYRVASTALETGAAQAQSAQQQAFSFVSDKTKTEGEKTQDQFIKLAVGFAIALLIGLAIVRAS